MNTVVRVASEEDAEAIANIYAYYVSNTAVSFEIEPPSVEEMRQRIQATLPQYPWLVAETAGRVSGYSFAKPYHTRPAYRWSVEPSVYVRAGMFRHGIGSCLYRALFDILRLQGFCSAFAGITIPNDASIAMHERFGFTAIGVLHSAGFKFGNWRDVSWWQKVIQLHPSDPQPPIEFRRLAGRPDLLRLLEAAVRFTG